jgi:hypothetical protein
VVETTTAPDSGMAVGDAQFDCRASGVQASETTQQSGEPLFTGGRGSVATPSNVNPSDISPDSFPLFFQKHRFPATGSVQDVVCITVSFPCQ